MHQAIQKEIDKLMNPEDTKMSKEEQTEYNVGKGIMTDEDRENMKKMRLFKKR